MHEPTRRSVFGLMAGALAAPAIIKTPGLLMLPPLKRVHLDVLWAGPSTHLAFSKVKLVDGRYEQCAIGNLSEEFGKIRLRREVRHMRTMPTEWYMDRA